MDISRIDVKEDKQGRERPHRIPSLQNIKLDTFEDSREYHAQVIRAYSEGIISETNLRALVYALSSYLSYWKLAKDTEYEERLEAIEERLDK